jgi:hypothetical protein
VLFMFVFHWLEGWGLADAMYFCVVTITTVGYGELCAICLSTTSFITRRTPNCGRGPLSKD